MATLVILVLVGLLGLAACQPTGPKTDGLNEAYEILRQSQQQQQENL